MTTTVETPVKKALTTTACKRIYAQAIAAADAAYDNAITTPMVVGSAKSLFGPGSNEIDYTKRTYYVPEGPCGFGWVTIHPARGKFVAYLKSQGIGSNGYKGGWQIWSPTTRNGQSYQRNYAAARAFAGVLQEHGITAYGEGRLD